MHLLRLVGGQQALPQPGIAEQAAEAGENRQVLGHRRRDQQEEQPRGNAVDGVIRNALLMPAKHHDRLVHQAHQGIARVRQRDAVADAGAVQLLALMQRAQQRLPGLRLLGELGNLIDQFARARSPGPRSSNPD